MKVTINDGQNVIQNLNDGFLNAWIINKPLAVNWPDCAGSVGEYYSVSNYSTEKREKLTNNLNDILINGNEDQLFSNVGAFLKLFNSGDYNITLTSMKLVESVFHHDENTNWGAHIKQD
jgi:hypothetical protein